MTRLGTALALATLSIATVSLAADTAPLAGEIAWVELGGELWIARPDGTKARKVGPAADLRPAAYSLTPAQNIPNSYRWPLWSPDGKKIAAFYSKESPAGPEHSLYVLDSATGRATESYTGKDLRPIYAHWAPDSSRFAFLHQTGPVHTLSLWPAEGGDQPQDVAGGIPLFFDWSRDTRSMVLHVGRDRESKYGQSVSLLDLATKERKIRTDSPAAFGPASWSKDGSWLAYGIERSETDSKLVIERPGGKDRKELLPISPEAAFNWSPDGKRLAVGRTTNEKAPLLERILVVDVPSGKSRTIVEDTVGAFFWSPDGKKILYAARDLEKGDWQWVVVDVATSKATRLARFLPSPALVFVFQFFDQYALSHRFWSPDGKAFVFTGFLDPSPQTMSQPPSVWIVPVDPPGEPRALAPGHVAFWSPK